MRYAYDPNGYSYADALQPWRDVHPVYAGLRNQVVPTGRAMDAAHVLFDEAVAEVREMWEDDNAAWANKRQRVFAQTADEVGTWTMDSEILPIETPWNDWTAEQRDEWLDERFPTWHLPHYNLRMFEMLPHDVDAFYGRNKNGHLLRTQDGRPYVLYEKLIRYLAKIVSVVVSKFGWVTGSMLTIQLFGDNDIDLSHATLLEKPTWARVEQALNELNDGITSAGQHLEESMLLRVVLFTPGTGQCGVMPHHLVGRNKAVWNPEGEYCGAKALVVASSSGRRRMNLKQRAGALERAIQPLMVVSHFHKAVTFMEMKTMAKVLERNVVILDAFTFVTLYDGDNSEANTAYVLFDQLQRHYLTCTDPSALKSFTKWCGACKGLYDRCRPHYCRDWTCKFCLAPHDSKAEFNAHFFHPRDRVACEVCHRDMPRGCYATHLKTCNGHYVRCEVCHESYINADVVSNKSNVRSITKEQHALVCGKKHKYCTNCCGHVPPDHVCILGTKDYGGLVKKTCYVFDLEAVRVGEAGLQKVNFVSVRELLEPEEGESVDDYNTRHALYHKDQPPLEFPSLDAFCRWIVPLTNTMFFAHNLSSYDGVLVLNHLRYEMGVKTDAVMVGMKPRSISWGSNHMRDTLCHLTTSLSRLPRTVGLKVEGVGKTHFPHKFNIPENQSYQGPLPDLDQYEPEYGSVPMEEIEAWHDEEKRLYTPYTEKAWDFMATLKTYCHMDTLVLVLCFGAYRKMFFDLTHVDPAKSLTIASHCMKVYRSHTNGFMPEGGFTTLDAYEDGFIRGNHEGLTGGFSGGHTEMYIPRYECNASEKIVGEDVLSLYPYVMTEPMPIGRPTIYKGSDVPPDWCAEGKVGYVQCDVTPFKFDPARPYRKPCIGVRDKTDPESRLEFNLHPKTNLIITIAEARYALHQGYTMDRVHEVHLYESTTELFSKYVYTFLKVKTESSPPPDSLADADVLVAEYRRRHGIELDRDKLMEPENSGLRALSKLCLNSLWGKWCETPKDTQKLCTPKEFHALMERHNQGAIEVQTIYVDKYLKNAVTVRYRELKDASMMTLRKTNVAVAAHVTAYGRLTLQRRMDEIEESGRLVLYCDTDSVWYVTPRDDEPNFGKYLGEWEDEGTFSRFCGLAPKVYIIDDGRPGQIPTKVKKRAKGIRMSLKAQDVLTYESFCGAQTPLDEDETRYAPLEVEFNDFIRYTGGISVQKRTKALTYAPHRAKSRVNGLEPMVPYGPSTPRLTPPTTTLPTHSALRVPLPPVDYPGVEYGHRYGILGQLPPIPEEEEEEELTEETAENLTASVTAAQDQRREAARAAIAPLLAAIEI